MMKTSQAIQLRLECDRLVATGEADFDLIGALTSETQSKELLLLPTVKLIGALERLYVEDNNNSLLGSVGHVLQRILVHQAARGLRVWIEAGLESRHEHLKPAVGSRQCSICCRLFEGKKPRTLCNNCVKNLTPQEVGQWNRFRYLTTLRKAGPEKLLEKISLQSGLGKVPERILARHIRALPSDYALISFDASIEDLAGLESLLHDPEKLKNFVKKAQERTNADELSDSELEAWAGSLPSVERTLNARGLENAIALCASSGSQVTLDLSELGKRFWPDGMALFQCLAQMLSEPLSLTFHNMSSRELFSNWGTPGLYEFRRILNLELMSELADSPDVRPEFKAQLQIRGMSLAELKQRIAAVGSGFSTYLLHSPPLDNELFLAWMASTSNSELKFDLLLSPPKEIIQLSEELQKRSQLKFSSSKGSSKIPWLHYPEASGREKPPQGYIQRSWGKRFWS